MESVSAKRNARPRIEAVFIILFITTDYERILM
jgi:hypothetical protein